MGLDMQLSAKTSYYDSLNSSFRSKSSEALQSITNFMNVDALMENGEDNSMRASAEIQIAYWRKVNAIHKYFVDNCARNKVQHQENSVSFEVSLENLQELMTRCMQVLENRDLASELLPTNSDLSSESIDFGSTNYDGGYFIDIEKTVEMLGKILSEIESHPNWDLYYRASW